MSVPQTVQDVLRLTAEYLDVMDQAVVLLAEMRGVDVNITGRTVQEDLGALAVWFDTYHDAAESASFFVCGRPGRE